MESFPRILQVSLIIQPEAHRWSAVRRSSPAIQTWLQCEESWTNFSGLGVKIKSDAGFFMNSLTQSSRRLNPGFQVRFSGEPLRPEAIGAIPRVARKGRAGYPDEQSAGVRDPGAASIAILSESPARVVSSPSPTSRNVQPDPLIL